MGSIFVECTIWQLHVLDLFLGQEHLTDIVQDAKLGFVVKAIYALAHALHNMHEQVCEPRAGLCGKMASLDGGMFLEFLHNVSFKYDGEDVFFDENGDPPPRSVIVKYVAR